MASFSIPLTGLEADSTALNTIANDLSNMNTTGFKSAIDQLCRPLLPTNWHDRQRRPNPGGRRSAGGFE